MLSAKELARERRLVEASQRDGGRFARLYDRYFPRVYAFALTCTHNRTAAEDITSETFRRAFENLSSFQWQGVPFSAWLFRIARNVAVDLHKRATRETGLEDLSDETPDSWETHLIEMEVRVFVIQLVQRLPRDERRVIAMRFGQERSTREIAQALGRSEGAVKQLQFRAIQRLRAWVGKRDG